MYARWPFLRANFAERRTYELRRIPLPRTSVNKGMKRAGAVRPRPLLKPLSF